MSSAEPRLIGVGALNLDYVADLRSRPELRALVGDHLPELRWGSELGIDPERFEVLHALLADRIVETRLGGSSFNAIRAARARDPALALGYVGMAGGGAASAEFLTWFDENRIDAAHVGMDLHRPSGSCLSLIADGERTLITTRGANDRTGERLSDDSLIDWAARSSFVHITSFLDDQSPERLERFLSACRARNPGLFVSIDPGAHWSRLFAKSAAVRALLRHADLCFVNSEEFTLIYGRAASGVKGRTQSPDHGDSERILLKEPGRLTLCDAQGRRLASGSRPRLPEHRILNPTGAGDRVAGAVLAHLAGGNPLGDRALSDILEWIEWTLVAQG